MSRILVVDDQNIPRVAVSQMLEQGGHSVLTADSGQAGLRLAQKERPDVIVLDVNMPEMDGFQVVEKLKADELTAPTPVIFLTAEPPTDDLIVRGLDLGAYDFLGKDCSRAELLARVGVMARIKRANDELSAVARISESLIQTLDPEEMTSRFVRQVLETFRCEAALLSYGDADDEIPRFATVGVNADRPLWEALETFLQEMLGENAASQLEINAGDLTGPASLFVRRFGINSVLAARIEHGDRRPTLLALLCQREEGFSRQSDQPLLELLARQATIALDNAFLHERAQLQAIELERAMTERSRFFASMSHELRTPINAVVGYNELLSIGAYGEMAEEQRKAVERVSRSANHLLELINDVLDISKMEAGKLELNVEEVDLTMLLKETVPTVQIQAQEKGLEVKVDAEYGAIVQTDPARVRQIFLNLLSNAVKFTDDGEIRVTVTPRDPGGYLVAVRDTGPGIAPEDQARVFEEFEQSNQGTAQVTGTGLGLPISRRLATLLGGSLTLESTVGKGSTFRLELPPTAPSRNSSRKQGE